MVSRDTTVDEIIAIGTVNAPGNLLDNNNLFGIVLHYQKNFFFFIEVTNQFRSEAIMKPVVFYILA